MNKSILSERSLFALFAILFCLVLSFRPIPPVDVANDTGRYVAQLNEYCSGDFLDKGSSIKNVSYNIFYSTTSPACWFESDRLFLFEVAFFLPLGFLLFSKWRRGTLLWATALFFSVIGLELMVNAMRQNFAMLLFFGAIASVQTHRKRALVLGALAGAAHVSVMLYLPLLLWMVGVRLAKKWLVGIIVFMALLFLTILRVPVVEFVSSIAESRVTYSIIYVEKLKVSFILFMVVPLFFVYGVRRFFNQEYITDDEKKGIIYSSALLLLSYIIFPYITYRFAIFATALQIFLITRSGKSEPATGGYVLLGLIAHLSFMLVMTDHLRVLFYG